MAVERPESSPGSPPLVTDDPGTPGKHAYEINFNNDCDLASSRHVCETGLDVAIGIGDKVQFRVSKYVTNDKATGERGHMGFGSTDVGVKWRFYDKGGWQAATFPSFDIADATRFRNSDGTFLNSEGRSVYLPLIISHEIGQRTTVVANVGYRQNFDHSESSSVFTSAAIARAIDGRSRAMIEITSEKSRSSIRRTDVRVGYIRLISKKNKPYQVFLNASLGRSVGATDDGKGHTTLLFGLTFAKHPRK